MKRITFLSIIFTCLFAFTACDRLTDNNGDLGGMWQLTCWMTRDAETGNIDHPVADKTSNIYYSIHRNLFKFTKGSATDYHFAYFKHEGTTLSFHNIVHFPDDKVCEMDDLSKYGVPSSGSFHIDVLNGDEMVLSDPDNVLTFRKY